MSGWLTIHISTSLHSYVCTWRGLIRIAFAFCTQRLLTRGDPHVLVVGDPGLGKSQMLRALCNVAPRAVYACALLSVLSLYLSVSIYLYPSLSLFLNVASIW